MLPAAREGQLLVQEVGDELIVYDQARHRAHRLNRTAAFIWRRCDGRTTIEAIARELEVNLKVGAGLDVVTFATMVAPTPSSAQSLVAGSCTANCGGKCISAVACGRDSSCRACIGTSNCSCPGGTNVCCTP